jgi:hypothetical protein
VHYRNGEYYWGEYFFNGKLYSVKYISLKLKDHIFGKDRLLLRIDSFLKIRPFGTWLVARPRQI